MHQLIKIQLSPSPEVEINASYVNFKTQAIALAAACLQ